MKRFLFLLIVLAILPTSAFTADNRVAINDLVVNSNRTNLEFVGKGIAEMVAIELVKSKGVILIDRKKRTELMDEMEFALSDLADADSQVELGRMLAADYMIFGDLIDMDQKLLISMKMVNVQTGEIMWADKLMEDLSNYDYISGYFAGSILESLNAEVAQTTEEKIEVKETKNEEAVLAFSKAIDLYDKEETTEAKKELVRARQIDPESEAVKVYIRKLTATSPKFQVDIDNYATTYNPASFGIVDNDILYFWNSFALQVGEEYTIRVGDYNLKERENTQRWGAVLPFGKRLGLGVEVVMASAYNMVSDTTGPIYAGYNEVNLDNKTYGAYLGLGYRILDHLSLGIALQGSYTDDTPSHVDTELEDNSKFNISFDTGFLLRAREERLLFDMRAVYTTQTETYYDSANTDIEPGRLPFILAGSFSAAFLDRRLYLSLKANADFYPSDRAGYTLRAIPAVEFWPAPFLSLRGGYEYAQMDLQDQFAIGHGGFGGLSLVFGKWEISGNFTYRHKPIHVLPGYSLDDMTLMLGLIKNDTLLSR